MWTMTTSVIINRSINQLPIFPGLLYKWIWIELLLFACIHGGLGFPCTVIRHEQCKCSASMAPLLTGLICIFTEYLIVACYWIILKRGGGRRLNFALWIRVILLISKMLHSVQWFIPWQLDQHTVACLRWWLMAGEGLQIASRLLCQKVIRLLFPPEGCEALW